MAAPQPSSGNTPQEQQAVNRVTTQNAAQVAALLLLEYEAVRAVSGPLRDALNRIFRDLAARYVILFGSLEAPAADKTRVQQLTEYLYEKLNSLLDLDPSTDLGDFARRAQEMGRDYANRHLDDPVPAERVELQPELEDAVEHVRENIADAVQKTREFAEQLPIEGWDDLVRDMGRASQAATSVERTTTWAINKASSDALRQVAVEKGAHLLWVAEPDACRVCLALSGHVIDPMSGEGFDEEATFGKPGSAPDVYPPGMPLMGPPRHPNCRCHPELWFGPHVAPGGPEDTSLYNRPDVAATVDLPAALRREAKRSILYGWSLPSESGPARIDAARRLLQVGAGLPKSVEERAHAAVAKGQFDNRIHPSRRRTARRP